jgi:outer membrane protein assembly factor BamA
MKIKRPHIILGGLFLTLLAGSCSTVKHLPEDEVLYLGTRSLRYYSAPPESEQQKVKKKADKSIPVIQTLWVKPNGALLGMPFIRFIPFRLYFYNWFYTERDSTFSSWMMENFGEPPTTISDVNPEARVKLIENQLFNQGYFGVTGAYDLKYKKNGKENKAWIRYNFVMTDAYTYRQVEVKLDSSQQVLRPSIETFMNRSLLQPGDEFNLDQIAREKQLLWEHLQNEGYYHFRKDHILIIADTTVGDREVNLEYRIESDPAEHYYEKVMIGEKKVELDPSIRVSERLLEKAIPIEPDSLYSLENTKRSIRNISSLGIFGDPVISYEVVPDDSSRVNAKVDLGATDLFTLGANSNLTMKNTGYIGPNLGVFATRKNLFGGGQNLTLALDGYLDFPYGVLSDRVSRSNGFTAEASLSTPVLRTPLPIGKKSVGLPRRIISLSVELNHRVNYFKIIEWKTSYGISWNRSRKINHTLNLVNLTYTHLTDSTSKFKQLVKKSDLIEYSYRDQFIVGPSYTFTYNNTLDQSKRFRTYYRGDIETSGNLLQGIYLLSGNREQGKEFLGVPFSQYIRLYSDFRAYYQLGHRGRSQLAFRNVVGWGAAYGNSRAVPYTRQFFIGGSNSLRPITARVVGPGRYLEFDEAAYNQVGDIKIENNLEFRFKIWYILHGALWSDLGNIWLLKEDPQRPGSGIRFGKILQDSYLTSGAGLRADLGFLVVRVDYGAIMYFPFLNQGYRWIWQSKLPLHGLVFGIGYPF